MPNYNKPMTIKLRDAVNTKTWLQLLALQQHLRRIQRHQARVVKR